MAKNAKTKKQTSAKQPAKKQTAAKQTETKQTAAKQATTKQAATKQTAGKQTAAKQSAKAGKKADATQSKGQKALAAVKKWFRDLKAEIKKNPMDQRKRSLEKLSGRTAGCFNHRYRRLDRGCAPGKNPGSRLSSVPDRCGNCLNYGKSILRIFIIVTGGFYGRNFQMVCGSYLLRI